MYDVYILEYEATQEDKREAMEHYKSGGEIGIYLPLPYHTNLDVLVTNRMGYYNTTGRFIEVKKPEFMYMLKAFVNLVNYSPLSGAANLYHDNFLRNLSPDIREDTRPYLDNQWIPESKGLVEVKDHIYADPRTYEFVRVTDGKRKSIMDGIFKSAYFGEHYTVTVLDWFNKVNPDMMIVDDKITTISGYIEEKYGKRLAYRLDHFTVHIANGEKLTITRAGRINSSGRVKGQ